MATNDGEDISSAHGNGCESCCHRHHPDGGHCYMFKEEPEACFAHKYDREFVEQTIENIGRNCNEQRSS